MNKVELILLNITNPQKQIILDMQAGHKLTYWSYPPCHFQINGKQYKRKIPDFLVEMNLIIFHSDNTYILTELGKNIKF